MPDIRILDLQFLGLEQTISAFLVITGEGPVLVETGPHSTIRQLEAEVNRNGFSLEEIRHVLLTHIHLDHAGAAWYLADKGAIVYLHPFGAKHMADPSKLMESARRIYKDQMDFLWGQMHAIQPEQLREVADNEELKIGGTTIKALHTPGHASHHIAWQLGEVLFTGDVAGVKIEGGPVVPPCPPPDINIEDWEKSIDRILKSRVNKLYLTHFGIVEDKDAHLTSLKEELMKWAFWIKEHMEKGLDAQAMTPLFQEFVAGNLRKKGLGEHRIKQYEAANPSWMSVAGLMRYWSKKAG